MLFTWEHSHTAQCHFVFLYRWHLPQLPRDLLRAVYRAPVTILVHFTVKSRGTAITVVRGDVPYSNLPTSGAPQLSNWNHLSACMYSYIALLRVSAEYFSTIQIVHIGIDDTRHSFLNESIVEQMSKCTSFPVYWAWDAQLERQCQPGASGRYVYVYAHIHLFSGLAIRELQIYGGRKVEVCK